MFDNISLDAQEAPWDVNLDYDFDEWVDPELPNPWAPGTDDWMNGVDWNAGIPDASGSCNADPISDSRRSRFGAGDNYDSERPVLLDGCLMKGNLDPCSTEAPCSVTSPATPVIHDAVTSPSATSTKRFSKATTLSSRIAKAVTIRCSVKGCKHKGGFKGQYELGRHTQSLHGDNSAKRFVCHAQGCYKGQLPCAFARADKLTAHIKAVHTHDTIFTRCPDIDCGFGFCDLTTLGIHIQRLHPNVEEGRAVLNATPCKVVRCPLWRCRKYFPAKTLLAHFADHSKDDLESSILSLNSLGLVIHSTPEHHIKLRLICPVCGAFADDVDTFIEHITTDHLCTPTSGGSEHFREWKAYCTGATAKNWHNNIKGALPWSRFRGFYAAAIRRDFQCPSCSFFIANDDRGDWRQQLNNAYSVAEHHLSFLRPEAEIVAELYPYRMQILKLWPEFVSHPVFADFELPQQRSNNNFSDVSSVGYVNACLDASQLTTDDFILPM